MRPLDNPARETILLIAVAIVLTVVIAAPVLLDPSERIFGNELAGYHPDPYIVIDQFEGAPRLTTFTQPATDWVGIAVARVTGGVVAYNLLVLATFPLAALFAFLLARRLGLGAGPGALAALAFAFSPFHLAHAAYHPHIAQIQWLPAYLLTLVLCLDRWSPRRAALLVAAGALLALSNFYAGLMALVITPIALPALWLARRTAASHRQRSHLLRTAATLAISGLIGGLYVFRVAGDQVLGASRFSFPYQDLFRYCARWWSYLVPGVEHPVLGNWAAALWDRHGAAGVVVEQQVFLGFSMLALALVALTAWARAPERARPPIVALVPALAVIAVLAFAFSLPPEGRLALLPRPSAMLHAWLPMFRAYARFGLAVQLMVFLMAAVGLTVLIRSSRRRVRATGLLLAVLAVFELAPLPASRWRWVLPTEAHRWADAQDEPMKILDCDRSRPGEAFRLKRMRHFTRIAGGTVSDCGEPGLSGKLAALDYSHLIVRDGYPLAAAVPSAGFESAATFADSRILAVTAAPSAIYTGAIRGFFVARSRGSGHFSLDGSRGRLGGRQQIGSGADNDARDRTARLSPPAQFAPDPQWQVGRNPQRSHGADAVPDWGPGSGTGAQRPALHARGETRGRRSRTG